MIMVQWIMVHWTHRYSHTDRVIYRNKFIMGRVFYGYGSMSTTLLCTYFIFKYFRSSKYFHQFFFLTKIFAIMKDLVHIMPNIRKSRQIMRNILLVILTQLTISHTMNHPVIESQPLEYIHIDNYTSTRE